MLISSGLSMVPLGAMPAFAAASVTPATGGSAILSTTAGGTYTSLTGPVITGIDDNDLDSSGTVTLVAPSGFQFDIGGTAPTVLVTCTSSCGGGSSNNVNNVTQAIPSL